MKKIKIMLTAIVVLAVVGGTVAFKLKEPADKLFFCNGATAISTCDYSFINGVTFGDGTFVDLGTITDATDIQGKACTARCDVDDFEYQAE
jgi:hypothetical protein